MAGLSEPDLCRSEDSEELSLSTEPSLELELRVLEDRALTGLSRVDLS
jgi:hypothetical protein